MTLVAPEEDSHTPKIVASSDPNKSPVIVPQRIAYVAGLLFSRDQQQVALIKKNKPTWQIGLYNAVGGKIEEGETPPDAMRREFLEEAGVDISWWENLFVMKGDGGYEGTQAWKVYFYRAFGDVGKVQTMTDEKVDVFDTDALPVNTIRNIPWIVPLAKDMNVQFPIGEIWYG
jgi:8-oxo-dGTP pyrophosphatase MutT (NUDIX family)